MKGRAEMSIWTGSCNLNGRTYGIMVDSVTERQIAGPLFADEEEAEMFIEWMLKDVEGLRYDHDNRTDFLRKCFSDERETFVIYWDIFGDAATSDRQAFLDYLDEIEPGCDPFERTPQDMSTKIDDFFKRVAEGKAVQS